MKEKVGLAESNDRSAGLIHFDQQFNQSASLVRAYTTLTSIVSPDSIVSFKLVDTSGSIEFIGKDSLDIPNFIPTNYSIKQVECCGGIKQKVDFNIRTLPDIRSNIWINHSDIVNQLQSSLGITRIRQLDIVSENGTIYNPIIFKVDSLIHIDKTIQYLKFIGDNIIVRKIDITNTPPDNNISGTFYLAIFEPL